MHSGNDAWSFRAGAAYFAACAALTAVWNGAYLFSDKVGILDWAKDLYYYYVFRGAVTEWGQLPVSLYLTPPSLDWFCTVQQTLSVWASPETLSFTPFFFLAFAPTTGAFIQSFVGAHFLLGIAGVGLLAKRLGFGPLEAACLYLLAALNPWLTQHLAIGYAPYVNALLFPGVAALLLARPGAWVQAALAAAGIALTFYQGALHLFVWFNLACLVTAVLACLARRSPGPLLRVLWVQAMTFVLIFPKYSATAEVYAAFVRQPNRGYASLADLWGLLTDSTSPLFDFPATYTRYGVAFYDGSLCVGEWFVVLSGLMFLAWATGFGPARDSRRFPAWLPLTVSAVFLVLGWNGNWGRITDLIPTLASEIYPFRWLYVAYLFMAVFTLGQLARLAESLRSPEARVLALVLALIPTAVAFYGRNADLAALNASQPDVYTGYPLKRYWTERLTAVSGETVLPVEVTPSRVTITPPGQAGDTIVLPWLKPERLVEFDLENARSDVFQPENATVLVVTQEARQVRLTPRTYHRAGLVWASLTAFAAMNAAAWRTMRLRRSPGRFGQPE